MTFVDFLIHVDTKGQFKTCIDTILLDGLGSWRLKKVNKVNKNILDIIRGEVDIQEKIEIKKTSTNSHMIYFDNSRCINNR